MDTSDSNERSDLTANFTGNAKVNVVPVAVDHVISPRRGVVSCGAGVMVWIGVKGWVWRRVCECVICEWGVVISGGVLLFVWDDI